MRAALRAWIRRHPAVSYFGLAFAISWGGILLVIGPTNVLASKETFDSLVWVPPLLLGPSVAGIAMTAIVGGRGGLRGLRSRLVRWRVGARWYAVALLTAPLYSAAASLALSGVLPQVLPAFITASDPAAVVIRGLVVALAAGIFEELGWTGFATPALRKRHGAFATGLIIGVLWGVWHVLPKLVGARAVGTLDYLAIDLGTAIVGLTGFRILMVWVYERTGSLLLGMLMHTGLTAAMMIVQPEVTGASLAALAIALAIAPWLVVGGVTVTRRAFVRRHPAASYFVLTFAISWGGVLAVAGPTHIIGTPEEFERLFPIALPFVALGPSLSGILMTWLVTGRSGLHELRSRLLRWRVGARWYAVALLTAPLYFLAAGLVVAAFSPQLMPAIVTADDKLALVGRGLAVALVAGVVEELGWTGFAVPTLRRRHGALATGLIVGSLWGAWHILPKLWGSAAHDLLGYIPADMFAAVVGLTGFRILMVWVYDATRSLLIAILMHLGLTASTLILQPAISGVTAARYGLILSAVPWVIVAAVAVWRRARAHGVRPRTPGALVPRLHP